MKALNILQFMQMNVYGKIDYHKKFTENDNNQWDTGVQRTDLLKLELDLNEWYLKIINQPFKPEMICEYFEGWEKRNIKNCEYENGVYRVSIDDEQKFIYYSYPHAIQCRKFPRNLDEFITDCQRADIDLELRIV